MEWLNEKGVESLKESFEITYQPHKILIPDLYIVAIGASEYKDKQWDLTYAAKDANDFSELFNKQKDNYENVFTTKILNQEVTVENIRKVKQKVIPAFTPVIPAKAGIQPLYCNSERSEESRGEGRGKDQERNGFSRSSRFYRDSLRMTGEHDGLRRAPLPQLLLLSRRSLLAGGTHAARQRPRLPRPGRHRPR